MFQIKCRLNPYEHEPDLLNIYGTSLMLMKFHTLSGMIVYKRAQIAC